MKSLALITFFLFIQFTIAQNTETIWVNQLTETAFTHEFIQENNILSVDAAFPASKNEELKNVVEVVCNCNANDLVQKMNENKRDFNLALLAPQLEILSVPNDYSLEFSNDYALDLINASDAWLFSTGDSSIQIAISDSNYDLNHEELQGNISHTDASFSSSNYYHGTAVAITAAGNTDNGLGKSAIGYNSSLQLRGMDYNSILEATYSGAKVINLSWSSGCTSNPYGQMVISEAYNNGSILVAAAGNGFTCGNSTALVYPAAYDHVIAVSSVGPMDNHERTIGDPNTTHQHNSSVDICAPGYDVALSVSSGWYLTGNGSSFAAPYVSGTIALMLDVNPCLSFQDVEYILEETAFNLDSLNPAYAGQLGAGRLNAGLAVEMATTYNKPMFTLNSVYNCNETMNVDLVLDSLSFTNTVSINWNNGDSGTHLNNLIAGEYICTVTNDSGCSTIDTIQITPLPSIEIDGITTPVECNGESTGSIELSINGGSGAFDIVWNTNDTTTFITDLTAGIYEVLAVDDMGCIQVESYQIDENPPLEMDLLTQDYFSEQDAGAIQVYLNGGTPDYTLEVNGVISDFGLSNLEAGLYHITATDQFGCKIEDSTVIEDNGSLFVFEQSENQVSVYPNPSSGQFQIDAPNGTTYRILNSQAELVETGQVLNSEENIHLSPGVYLIQLNMLDGTVQSEKMVIR